MINTLNLFIPLFKSPKFVAFSLILQKLPKCETGDPDNYLGQRKRLRQHSLGKRVLLLFRAHIKATKSKGGRERGRLVGRELRKESGDLERESDACMLVVAGVGG